MPPPAASVDFRPPSASNFSDSQTQTGNPNPYIDSFSFNSGCSSSPSSLIPPSIRVGPGTSTRPKRRPRLVKQRRGSKTTTFAVYEANDLGNNPFKVVNSSNVDSLNCYTSKNGSDSVNGAQINNVSFVFGGLSPSNGDVSVEARKVENGNVNLNSKKEDCNVSENKSVEFDLDAKNRGDCNVGSVGIRSSDDVGDHGVGSSVKCSQNGFVLEEGLKKLNIEKKLGEFGSDAKKQGDCDDGGVGTVSSSNVADHDDCGVKYSENGFGFGLEEGMRNLIIENEEKGSCGTAVADGEREFFVFKSGDKPVPFQSRVGAALANERKEDGDDGNCSGLGARSVDENVFVFGTVGNSNRVGGSAFQSATFSAEIDGRREEDDVLRRSFSSSSVGAEGGRGTSEACSVSGETRTERSAPSTPEGFRAPASEFRLPEFDVPLSFSANLSSEFKSNFESRVRNRGLRDKSMKKTKGKVKHPKLTKQQPVETPVSATNAVQEQEGAECCSPMDFSPYGEVIVNDDGGNPSSAQSNVEPESKSGVSVDLKSNQGFSKNEQGTAVSESSTGFRGNENGQDGNGAQFNFSFDGKDEETLVFTASYASSFERRQKKKYRLKHASIASRTPKGCGPSPGVSPFLRKVEDSCASFPASASKGMPQTNGDEEQGYDSASVFCAVEKACDKWRRRGNEAYAMGEFSKAEEYYSQGMNYVPPPDAPRAAFTALVRCFSNRAATRMALGRTREALLDSLMAFRIEPTFHRAQMRAANCYLQLGELEGAIRCFGNILDATKNSVCLDRQITISASEGIQKAQKVTECINRSAELLKLRTSEAAASALKLIAEAMSISSHSEKLLEMKAEFLCMLRRHEEAITLCQETLDFAEKNFSAANDSFTNIRPWRHCILSKCHFHLGKLEVALDLIEKRQSGDHCEESLDSLAGTIRALLNLKSSGNSAFQSGNHAEAVEHYTTAILSSMESPPFTAICFCNRAAAQQALGQIADAISDCSIAIALDESYAKAVSRRATLHEMIRDYKQATADLQRLISILEKQSLEKSKQSGSGNGKELRHVQRRLSLMEEEAKRNTPLDFYLILGVKKSDPASEIKKAYRKAALRHHPDKAGQSLVRNDVGDEGHLWRGIAELVQKDSDRLFKMIGEAYAVLSDPEKREEYDQEEETRKALKERNNLRSTSRRHSEYYYQGHPFERSGNSRSWQDSYRTYAYAHKRW